MSSMSNSNPLKFLQDEFTKESTASKLPTDEQKKVQSAAKSIFDKVAAEQSR